MSLFCFNHTKNCAGHEKKKGIILLPKRAILTRKNRKVYLSEAKISSTKIKKTAGLITKVYN